MHNLLYFYFPPFFLHLNPSFTQANLFKRLGTQHVKVKMKKLIKTNLILFTLYTRVFVLFCCCKTFKIKLFSSYLCNYSEQHFLTLHSSRRSGRSFSVGVGESLNSTCSHLHVVELWRIYLFIHLLFCEKYCYPELRDARTGVASAPQTKRFLLIARNKLCSPR